MKEARVSTLRSLNEKLNLVLANQEVEKAFLKSLQDGQTVLHNALDMVSVDASNNVAEVLSQLAAVRASLQIIQSELGVQPPAPSSGTLHVAGIRFGDGIAVQGRIDTMQMTDSEKCTVTWGGPVDKKGLPAQIQGAPTFSASDDSVTVTPNPDNQFACDVVANHPSPVGTDGAPVAGTITITGDADLGDGVAPITGVEPYIITGGQAVSFGAPNVGTITEQ